MCIVCVASVILGGLLDNERNATSEAPLSAMEEGASLLVPDLWFHDMGNTVHVCEKRGHLNPEEKTAAIRLISNLPLERHPLSGPNQPGGLMAMAQRHNLSVYDATYLELAVRECAPLATLDKSLAKAASAEKVRLFKA